VPAHIGILDAPKYVEIIYGNNSGEVTVNIDKVNKATDYLLLYMPAPASADNNEWFSKVFSKSTGTLHGLKSGTKYAFKATAMSSEANKMDSYNFSSTIEKLIP